MLNETKKMIILPPGGDLGLHEDVGLVAPGGGGAPASHNGRHRVIVGGGVGQTGGHHGAAEAEGGGQLEQREVIVGGGGVIRGVGQPGARGHGDLAVSGVSVVVLRHNNPEVVMNE